MRVARREQPAPQPLQIGVREDRPHQPGGEAAARARLSSTNTSATYAKVARSVITRANATWRLPRRIAKQSAPRIDRSTSARGIPVAQYEPLSQRQIRSRSKRANRS